MVVNGVHDVLGGQELEDTKVVVLDDTDSFELEETSDFVLEDFKVLDETEL